MDYQDDMNYIYHQTNQLTFENARLSQMQLSLNVGNSIQNRIPIPAWFRLYQNQGGIKND